MSERIFIYAAIVVGRYTNAAMERKTKVNPCNQEHFESDSV